jgi:hypothetical protein
MTDGSLFAQRSVLVAHQRTWASEDGDRYFLSDRLKTLKAIRAKIRPELVRKPLSPAPKPYAAPRASAARRRR